MLRVAGAGSVGAATEALVDADEYRTRWRESYAPLAVGRRLSIVPAWLEQPPEQAGRIPVFLDAGMAFGTGRHPTTQLALEALESVVVPGDVVADVGTGSGVLAIAAVKLGAKRVYAFDRDPDAGPAAQANVRRNDIADRVSLTIPSTDIVMPEPATLVIANIVTAVHERLMTVYARLLAPSGRLLLGGILSERAAEVTARARECGFGPTFKSSADEWVTLGFELAPLSESTTNVEFEKRGEKP
jgi:ribosomal protein L11 methyltransferase